MEHQISIIIPVFNRPDEVDELLESMTTQTSKNFEVVIVEDGSTKKCDHVVERYRNELDVKYFYKNNSGPGQSRNYGFERATGSYVIFLDSDCVLPPHYFRTVEEYIATNKPDCFGGPDMAHTSFSPLQKAINYSMTSFLTTGGIRGGKRRLDRFLPRSFNMGVSREAFGNVGGFGNMRFGEDIDLSLRIIEKGYSTALVSEAYVYHKRRTSFKKFYKQVYNSGMARINLHLKHPGSLKLVHALPSAFVVAMIAAVVASIWLPWTLLIPVLYSVLLFSHSLLMQNGIKVAMLSVPAAWVQLFGYGLGFMDSFINLLILKKKARSAFQKNFYG